jgi:hypothetical protein
LLSNIVHKLHLGAGPNVLNGWLNSDIAPHHDKIVPIDVTTPLPFEDSTFDFAFGEHMIEHLTLEQGFRLLVELHRVMRPGAAIRMATPDLMKIMSLFTNEPTPIQKQYVEWTTKTFIGDLQGYNPTLVLNNMFYNWGHRFLYNQSMLASLMRRAGFTDLTLHAAGESARREFLGLDKHGDATGAPEMAAFETMAIEARRP